ncbi:MAG: tRNA-specific adenosine deaminase [Acidobacteria bacterium]|nr:tRNA-specific adenosine deaminase [Acidobacteriota bacterium]
METHEFWMREALREAESAHAEREVPVGAVVVYGREVIGRGHNQPIGRTDPTAHAEVLALREAAFRLGNYRLGACRVYVTIEPCAMCAGALLVARVSHLIFGARDAKAGASHLLTGSKIEVIEGVLEAESRSLIQRFFAERRGKEMEDRG